ncbi:MAG TPA: HypC/HybG/HupF family hydrogenase formation chaperone [Candidatus Hydrogenedentes bacterium]|nr:HypC/HybG/HupF family hydrogenase formation chaperone [Candidatus Hydrogenedentota bacterium]HRK35764.1 HypC/HybG/HupF family hydrogenase formation chaperone [Candidatus Hydrogenedentota bacterium]
MCLAIPGEIISIDESDALLRMARVDFGGIVKAISLAMVPTAEVGQFVLAHAGIGIGVVDEAEATKIFTYLAELGALEELEETSE